MLEQGLGQRGHIVGPGGGGGRRGPGRVGGRRGGRRRASDPGRGQFRRQVPWKNRLPLGYDQGAADDVFQLAHVAGPVITLQRLEHFVGNGFGRLLLFLGELFEKIVHEETDVLPPLAQGRQRD